MKAAVGRGITEKRRAIVIGGGLAGMTAAKELARHGMQVLVLERQALLGGKAGAAEVKDRWEDHGYHFFPAWYLNTRALLQEIDCHENLADLECSHALRRGEFPRLITSYAVSSPTNFFHNLFRGTMPWHDNLLTIYYAMDLATAPFSDRAFLDRISALGFLRSRFYATEALARYHHETVLQAVSSPYYDCSAMTLRKLFRAWMQHPSPLFSILKGNLYEKFIKPFKEHIERLGVEVRSGCQVTKIEVENGRVRQIELKGQKPLELDSRDVCVLAVPPERVLDLVDSEVVAAEVKARLESDDDDDRFGLADLVHLRSAPMASWSLHLTRRIPGVPKEHVLLIGSRLNMSLLDISTHWGLDYTAFNCIISNYEPLRTLTQDQAKDLLVQELREYITDIVDKDLPDGLGHLQPHLEDPLFLNTVGAWHYRPGTTTAVKNLFVAGDYCRTQADITTMESAVMSGLSTAGEILRQAGITDDVGPLSLGEPSDLMLTAAKYAMLPAVLPLALAKQLQERLATWFTPAEGV